MEKEIISSKRVPQAVAAYSQAVRYGEQIYSAGQIGLDPENGKLVSGGIEAQTRRALENVKLLLEDSGSSLENVLKVTLYLTDMADFAKVNEIYRSYFKSPLPARSAVAVKSLPLGALIELDFIAHTH